MNSKGFTLFLALVLAGALFLAYQGYHAMTEAQKRANDALERSLP